jgi:hypothetical protein
MKQGTLEDLIPKSKHVFVLTKTNGTMYESTVFVDQYASAVKIQYNEINGVISDGMETFYLLGVDPAFDIEAFKEAMKKAED